MSAICKEYCSRRSFDDMLEFVTKSGASKPSSAISTWLLMGIRFQCKPDSSGHSTVEEKVCSRFKFLLAKRAICVESVDGS